jgi:hypothetical protein
MVPLRGVVETQQSQSETFQFVADFENLPRWDPGIERAVRTDGGELGVGSRFEVVARFFGRRVTLEYEVKEYEPPSRIVLEGRGGGVHALDIIHCVSTTTGCRIEYRAELSLEGVTRFAEPAMKPLFERMGRRAVAGLSDAVRGSLVSAA